MAATGCVAVADWVPAPGWAAVPDAPGTLGGAQIHIPLPTGTGPLTAGTTGLGWGGAVGDPLGVVGFGVVPFVWPAGPAGTTPGRLWSGWDSGAGMVVEGAAG